MHLQKKLTSAFHVFFASTAQLKGSTGPEGAWAAVGRGGGAVGGSVGGGVSGGVGDAVG